MIELNASIHALTECLKAAPEDDRELDNIILSLLFLETILENDNYREVAENQRIEYLEKLNKYL